MEANSHNLYALIQLGEVIDLEKERKQAKLWFPTLAATFLFWWTRWNGSSDMDHTDDEDPGGFKKSF